MINTKKRFTVIHPPKTGGNSVHAFMKNNRMYTTEILSTTNQNGANQGIDCNEFMKHATIKERAERMKSIGEDPSKYKFLITVRNPYDAMVSMFHWETNHASSFEDTRGNFERWLFSRGQIYRDWFMNIVDGREGYCYSWIRLEQQDEILSSLRSEYGLEEDTCFKEAKPINVSLKRNQRDFRDYYLSDRSVDYVESLWKELLGELGYGFYV